MPQIENAIAHDLSLAPFLDDFRALVLGHMKRMPSQEWTRLRVLSVMGGTAGSGLTASPEEVLRTSFGSPDLRMSDVMNAFMDYAEVIGTINDAPAYYFSGLGYYAWG